MEFTFSDEQDALRDAVRSFVARDADIAYVRGLLDDPVGVTPQGWSSLADLGWTGLLVPEEHGGLGLGLTDVVVVQEELGRGAFPGPFFSSAILATLAALWGIAYSSGSIGKLQSFLEDVGLENFTFYGNQMFRAAAAVGAVGVMAGTVITVLATALVNMISEVTGGIRLVVIEEDVDR